jgi:transcriptional regulator with XRE-family HTH domain
MRPDLSEAYAALREEIVKARKRVGVSQSEVADVLGAHQQFWSKVESGERRLDIVELVAVAGKLQLSVTRLVKRLREELDKTEANEAPQQ